MTAGIMSTFFRDDAQVVHAGVLDRDRKRGIGEVGNFELAVGECRHHGRGTGEANRFDRVGLAEMPREILLLQDDRGPVGDRGDPGQADLHGLSALRRAGAEERGGSDACEHQSR